MRNTIFAMLTVALMASSCARQPKLENECQYAQSQTSFAFWSPVAEQMEVIIYEDGVTSDQLSVISIQVLKRSQRP